ncbi:hypothetical protein P7D22_00820 [Lichenihabitans sp. Uapishka_5]|uniref:hypothetical protein n=1 Tax=Lichenihabitans sp. Uapishka_5 TaxID=3037302 RepID=UPI0029E7FC62|nr:hypothetical protein [Lichenihabitans sp. Uapishka_5]MDX7949719.1 hypothetical protein [Lichenihabitans sp. Uapishka_5]
MTLIRTAAALALMLASGAAYAQNAAPAAPAAQAAPAATAAGSAELTKDGKPRMKVVRAQCRDVVKSQDLKGDARKQAMADCIVKQRPDMEARVKCHMDPSLKTMDKGARSAAIKACVAKTKA